MMYTNKVCYACKEEHPLENFHKHSKMKDGLLNKCKYCVLKSVLEWRSNNPESRKKEHARLREKKGFRSREQYFKERFENKIGRKASALKHLVKRRRIIEKCVMSDWDEFVFEEAFKLSELREKATGIKWHVDHIVPMFHKHACGLNVAANIQVVPAIWNMQKGNRNMKEYFSQQSVAIKE